MTNIKIILRIFSTWCKKFCAWIIAGIGAIIYFVSHLDDTADELEDMVDDFFERVDDFFDEIDNKFDELDDWIDDKIN